MSELRIVVVPVGRVPPDEVADAAHQVAKVLNRPVEVREPAPLSRGAEDPDRNQYRAAEVLAEARRGLPRLAVASLLGGAPADAPVPTPNADAAIFVTDADLFAPAKDHVFGELDGAHRAALLSVRRLREAFYRRKADPARQRARLVKQILRAIGLLRGLRDCGDPNCAMSAAQVVADLDRKKERYCAACWKRIATGAFRI